MLSIFPEFLDFGFYAPFLLRVAIGLYFISEAMMLIKHPPLSLPAKNNEVLAFRLFGGLLIVVGGMLVIGLFVQPVAIIGTAFGLFASYLRAKKSALAPQALRFYLLVTLTCFCLIILGPGIWAFDLPL